MAPIYARLIAAMLLVISLSSRSEDISEAKLCQKPYPGQASHACEALKERDLFQSKHLGDKWIDCEEMSGHHGTAGFGVAAFFAGEARPYWHEEIRHHLDVLEKSLPSSKWAKVQEEQAMWQRKLPKTISKASRNTDGEGGTLAMYIGEGNAMHVVRHRALTLACMAERIKE